MVLPNSKYTFFCRIWFIFFFTFLQVVVHLYSEIGKHLICYLHENNLTTEDKRQPLDVRLRAGWWRQVTQTDVDGFFLDQVDCKRRRLVVASW